LAQADALAYGKNHAELRAENVPDHLITHKTFTGNRPSLSVLVPQLDAYSTGQLLALYEHRVAVQGFVWGINSFDQWGVELGKVLATKVRRRVGLTRHRSACRYADLRFLPLLIFPGVFGIFPGGFGGFRDFYELSLTLFMAK